MHTPDDRPVPITRRQFVSADAAEITDYIDRTYAGNHTAFLAGTGPPRWSFEVAELPGLAADRWRCSIGFVSGVDPLPFLAFTHVRRGGCRTATRESVPHRRAEMCCVAGEDGLVPPDADLTGEANDLGLDMLRVPVGRVRDAAAAVHGERAGAALRFLDWRPADAALARYWRGVSAAVHRELLATESALRHPVLAEQAVSGLAIAALAAFPNTAMLGDPEPGPDPLSASALARAVDYLHAHPDGAVSVAEIAAVAGVTARALQYAFRRHYGTTPLGYHREVRLAAAHRELTAADPADGSATVAAIAARWGFGNAGRFAERYQRRYGHPPSRTLYG